MNRETTSVEPPAANGTTSVIGPAGNASLPQAAVSGNPMDAAMPALSSVRLETVVILFCLQIIAFVCIVFISAKPEHQKTSTLRQSRASVCRYKRRLAFVAECRLFCNPGYGV
jgi:hypothetical protein